MRQRLWLLGIVFVLAACQAATVSAPAPSLTKPASSPASVAESIVQQYISAGNTKNADLYLSLFSSDAITVDYGSNYGPFHIMDVTDDVHATYASKYFQYKVTSSFVSADGRFATLEGIYTDWIRGGNQTASVPCLVILEIKDGKIVKESIYYNGAAFSL